MKLAQRSLFFKALHAQNPAPTTELIWHSPFELLIAVILSAQATDKSVNIATRSLVRVAATPKTRVALGLDGIKEHIKTIGLYNTKAKNVLATAERLLALHQGRVPPTREALEALPGVGRKTANVILNCVFSQPTIAVDTHIFRVANRTGLAPGRTVLSVEKRLLKVVPTAYLLHAHHWLILLGRYTCKARKPECWRCQVYAECGFKKKTPDPSLDRPKRRGSSHRSRITD